MATQINTTNLSRRSALAGAAALLPSFAAVPAVAALRAVNPDAGLHALCTQFLDMQRFIYQREEKLSQTVDIAKAKIIEEEDDKLFNEHWKLYIKIANTPAHTIAGLNAKAELLLQEQSHNILEELDSLCSADERFVRVMLGDIGRLANAHA